MLLGVGAECPTDADTALRGGQVKTFDTNLLASEGEVCGSDAPCVAVYTDGRGIKRDVEAECWTAVLALLVLVQGGADIEEAVVELTLYLTPQVKLDV